jgi:hypothetical protein
MEKIIEQVRLLLESNPGKIELSVDGTLLGDIVITVTIRKESK